MPIVLTPIPADAFEGRYTTAAACATRFGAMNADTYADADSDGSPDSGAWQKFITQGESTVDLHTNGPYTFADSAQGEAAAAKFAEWAEVEAVFLAYTRRGLSDAKEGGDFLRLKEMAEREMAWFRDGTLNLPGAVAENEPEDDDTPQPGSFSFVPINRGTTCGGDEYSSG